MPQFFSIFLAMLALSCYSLAQEPAFDQKYLFSTSVKEGLKETQFFKNKRALYWGENYQKALKSGKESGKSLLIAFTGSEWCPWSQKLLGDVLIKGDFIMTLKDQFVLLYVEFPESLNFSPSEKEEKELLKNKYNIQELPTLVLVDADGEEITKVGYLPMESRDFALHLTTVGKQFQEIKDCLDNFQFKNCDAEELKTFYDRASHFSDQKYREAILNAGLQIDKGVFFLLEKYAASIQKKFKNDEALSLRKKIVERDPKNLYGVHLNLAMIDFQTLSSKPRKKDKPMAAVEPLLRYLAEFGQKDPENAWRVEMTIATHLFSKGLIAQALEHARHSYNAAPERSKPEIAQSINYIETQK